MAALKIILDILLVSTRFEKRESNFIFFPFVIDLDMSKVKVSSLSIFELFRVMLDSRKDSQIGDTIYASLPIL